MAGEQLGFDRGYFKDIDANDLDQVIVLMSKETLLGKGNAALVAATAYTAATVILKRECA